MQSELEEKEDEIGLEVLQADNLAKRQRLLALLRAKKAGLGLSDLFYFAKYVLGYKEVTEQPHRDMCDFIQNKDYRRKLDLEPRGSFKSSIITIAYTIQSIVKNPNIRILLDSEDLSISKKFLSEIKGHFENNEELIKLYGDYVGKEKWTETEIIVSQRTKIFKEPTILTAGIATTRVGMHVDLIVGDDYHSLQNTQTPEQIEKVIEHWKLNQSILEPSGEEIIVGTRWAVGDLYGHIIEQEQARRKLGVKKFLVRKKDATNDGKGGVYFPTRLTKEFLEEKRIELGPYIFSCQYKNNPVDDSAIIFKKNWFKFYGRYAPERLIITGTLDPAIGQKDENCFSNINIVGTDVDGFIYVLDNHRFKALPHEIIDAIFAMCNKWDVQTFGIEVVAYQKALKYWLWERMRNTGKFINIKSLKTDTKITKDVRIRGLIPFVESGTIQFPGTGPNSLDAGVLDLYNEMIEYPVGKYIDAIDSFAYQLQLYTPPALQTRIAPVERTFQTLMKERNLRVVKKGTLPIIGRRETNYAFPVLQSRAG